MQTNISNLPLRISFTLFFVAYFVVIVQNHCPSHHYYDQHTDQCKLCQHQTQCKQKTSLIKQNRLLATCSISGCVDCSATTCNLCSEGFYSSSTNICSPCDSLSFCRTCGNSATDCRSCLTGYIKTSSCLSCASATSITYCTQCEPSSPNPICVECDISLNYIMNYQLNQCSFCDPTSISGFIPYCISYIQTPTSPSCVKCMTEYYWSSGIGQCQKCLTKSPYCLQCQSATICTKCESVGQLKSLNGNIICKQRCGDGIAIQSQCDGGLNVNFDGCSNLCLPDEDFTCTKNLNISSCIYTGSITMIQVSANKQKILSNKVAIEIQIYPKEIAYVLPSSSLSAIFTITNPNYFSSIEYQITPSSNSQLTIILQYLQNVQNMPFTLTINTTSLSIPVLTTPIIATTTLYISNPDYAFQYQDSLVYGMCNFIMYFTILLVIGGVIAFIISVVVREIIGLQLILMFQYLYASLIFYKNLFPIYYSLGYFLVGVTGLNIRGKVVYRSDLQTQPMNFSEIFGYNYNIMVAILFIIPLFLSILFKIIKAICVYREQKQILCFCKRIKIQVYDLQYYPEMFRCEIIFLLACYNLPYYLIVSIIYYTGEERTSSSTILSIIVGLFTLYGFVLFCLNPLRYKFIRSGFKKLQDDNNFQVGGFPNFFLLFMCGGIIIPILINIGSPEKYFIPLILQLFVAAIVLLFKPYNSMSHNIRSTIFIFILSLISLMRIIQEQFTNNTKIQIFIVIFVMLALLAATIYTFIVLIKNFIQQFYTRPRKLKNIVDLLVKEQQNISNNNKYNDFKLGDYDYLKKIIDDGNKGFLESINDKGDMLLDKKGKWKHDKKDIQKLNPDKQSDDMLEESAQRAIYNQEQIQAEQINFGKNEEEKVQQQEIVQAKRQQDNSQKEITAEERRKMAERQVMYLKVKNAMNFKVQYGDSIDNKLVQEYDRL